MTKRTDVHRPSAIQPEDYQFVVVRCREDEEMGGAAYRVQEFNAHREITGGVFSNHDHGGNCDVCGAWCIDYAIFYHVPSNKYIKAGLDCSEKIEMGHADDFRRVAEMRRAAVRREKAAAAALEYLAEHNLDTIAEALFADDSFGQVIRADDPFVWINQVVGLEGITLTNSEHNRLMGQMGTLVDLIRSLVRWGSWSNRQLALAHKLAENIMNAKAVIVDRREQEAAMIDAPEGKVEITGKVVSTKWVEGPYNDTLKMLVIDDRNFKVWSTVPAAIDPEVGQKVRFTATLTRSDKDASFAFAKRPSKASIVV